MPHSNQSNQPAYGSRLLPQVLDDLAASKPERIYASLPKTFNLKDGFRDVTVLQISRAVNAIAWWLEKEIGRSSTFETVSYLGPPDIRYAIVFLAAVKCGYKVRESSSTIRPSCLSRLTLFLGPPPLTT